MMPAPLGTLTMLFSSRLACTVAFALATSTLAGCRGDDPAGSATDTDAATSTDGASSTSGTPTTSGTTSTGSTTDVAPTTSGVDTCGGFLGDCSGSSSSGGGALGDLGAMCDSDDQCKSGNCYSNPLAGGGVCSECNEDQDCVDAMTGISCSFGMSGWAVCEDGSLGDQCMSQDACQDGLFCDALINIPIPGVIPDFCGECKTSADCNGQICTPEIDPMTFTGAKKCVDKGSVPNDSLCPVGEPDANDACMSGHCSVATVMAIVMVGLCGECETDADCMMGTCQPAMVDPMGGTFAGSKCM
jgi:hypothetical protein